MADTQGSVNITPEELQKSFHTYRKELIQMPVFSLQRALPVFTLRTGVRYKETVGELSGDMQLRPYDAKAIDTKDVKIVGRTLETYLGSCVKAFDPNSVVQSIYGSSTVQGEGLKNVPITAQVAAFFMKKIGDALFKCLFTAKRNPSGTETKDLFDGLATIADNEILAGKISESAGNLIEVDPITDVNAEDVFNEIYEAADTHLQDEDTILLCSGQNYRKYCKAYQTNHGSLPYNQSFERPFIEGSNQKCRIETLPNVPADFLQISTKPNCLIGVATSGPDVKFEIKNSLTSHFWVDFVATMFMGCQYESISKERLLVAKCKAGE
ncbi:MAG: hypothetical protein ACI3Y0_04970 [Prevotella sp.]